MYHKSVIQRLIQTFIADTLSNLRIFGAEMPGLRIEKRQNAIATRVLCIAAEARSVLMSQNCSFNASSNPIKEKVLSCTCIACDRKIHE